MSTSATTGHPRPGVLIRESLAASLARPVPTIVITLVTALVCATVLLTTGRAVRAEQDVVSRLDQMGTLLIAASDNGGSAGMKASSITTLESLPGVDWVFGLGRTEDGHNAALPIDGTGVAARPFFGNMSGVVTLVAGRWPEPGEAIASEEASRQLGFADGIGGLVFTASTPQTYSVVGTYRSDPALRALGAAVIIQPLTTDWAGEPILYIYAKATGVDVVDSVVEAIPKVITATQPAGVTVESPEALRQARDAISANLASNSRYLMVATMATGLILVTVTMLAAVSDRKNDFGRRRALGASRSAIIVMVVIQAILAGLAGAIVGIGAAMGINLATGSRQSTTMFTLGLGALAVVCAALASLLPAILASRRDPVRILRVP